MGFIKNLFIFPHRINSVRQQIKTQKVFIHSYLHPFLSKYHVQNDGSLTAYDFEKITNYYGLQTMRSLRLFHRDGLHIEIQTDACFSTILLRTPLNGTILWTTISGNCGINIEKILLGHLHHHRLRGDISQVLQHDREDDLGRGV